MKWICLLLLLINLAYFGWTLDQRTSQTVQSRETALRVPADVPRLQRIREMEQPPLRRRETVQTPIEPIADTGAAADPIPELETRLPGISATLPESPIAPLRLQTDTCFSFGPFAERGQAERLFAWLQARGTDSGLRQEQTGQPNDEREQLSWVYLMAQEDAAATLRELRDRGISDVSLIETDDLDNAISLGLFSSQAAVNRRLRELQDKGYQPVVVPYSDSDAVAWVDARFESRETINALSEEFPAGMNYLPVRCDKIALPGMNP